MSEARADQRRRGRRWLSYGVIGVAALSAGYLFWGRVRTHADHLENPERAWQPEHPEPSGPPDSVPAAPPTAEKGSSPGLGVEYHFDRNAIADSRLVDGRLLALTTSGNLLTLDAASFALRGERVLRRRATCLGPADATSVLVGLANGAVVRVSARDLTTTRAGQVPGTPRWLGRSPVDGHLLVAYQPEGRPDSGLVLVQQPAGQSFDLGVEPILFLDGGGRLWIANVDKVSSIDMGTGVRREVQGAGARVRGFAGLADGQVWAFGGDDDGRGAASFVARVWPMAKRSLLYAASRQARSPSAPSTPISHVVEAQDRLFVVTRDRVVVTDGQLSSWAVLGGLDALAREPDTCLARGQAQRQGKGVLLALARGGVMEITDEHARRHLLDGQSPLARPLAMVRLADGLAVYGDGGPTFYARGEWQALPDQIMPPAELMGPSRPGRNDRVWAATLTIPIEEQQSYVVTKAGSPRNSSGRPHGLRDVFVTARWDGAVLGVLGHEELPIEPDHTFVTPDGELWNVDEQRLWSFNGGRWRTVMQLESAMGEPLHFAHALVPPFYGLPSHSASWSLVRLDNTEPGKAPLIDELAVKLEGRRALLRDLTAWGARGTLLLATDWGLCRFDTQFGSCQSMAVEGLSDQVSLFMRDGSGRLWLGGHGLWVMRDDKHAQAVSPLVPGLADTEVVGLAEAQDGRLLIGTANRGMALLALPEGWLSRPAERPPQLADWEASPRHEPAFDDPSIVLQRCGGASRPRVDFGALVTALRGQAHGLRGRARVELEQQYDSDPDLVLRTRDLDAGLAAVRALLEQPRFRGQARVQKRFGAPGSASVELVACR